MKVLHFPLARISIGFLLGILVAYYWIPNPKYTFGLLLLSFFGLLLTFWASKNTWTSKFCFGLFSYLISFLIGMTSVMVQTDTFRKNHYSHFNSKNNKEVLVSLVIQEKFKNIQNYERYVGIIQTINNQKYFGKILINLPKRKYNKAIEVGTIIQLRTQLLPNKKPKNPNQFDYSNYLKNKQIYAQIFANPESIKIAQQVRKDIWYYTAKLNSKITKNLEINHFNPEALAIATALILGQRQEIAPEIIQDYQYAGAVHILSVSGLHVGFIFLFLNFILQPIPNTRKGSFLKLCLILTSLFSFALIAGLSASVVRSVTMFSFVAIGFHLKRNVNIYHTLIVSILLILLFQPYFLFDVGFQLSYLAVFFIIWFQPILQSYWQPKNKFIKYCWDILTVSFAAQIGTLPLSLYYFHQFPGLFFITNLVVIPLLSVIMLLGVVIMVLAALNGLTIWLVKPFEWSIQILNQIIHFIASFEQFIIKDIPFNGLFLIFSYIVIITTILWFKKTHFKQLLFVLVSIISLQSAIILNNWRIAQQSEWIVFHLKKKTLLVQREGNEVYTYSNDSTITENKSLKSYLINHFSQIKKKEPPRHTAYFNGKKILILDSLGIFPKNSKPDIVVLTQTPKVNLDRFLLTVKPKIIIADGSNYQSILKQWQKSCEKQKIPFHATAEKGFFQLN